MGGGTQVGIKSRCQRSFINRRKIWTPASAQGFIRNKVSLLKTVQAGDGEHDHTLQGPSLMGVLREMPQGHRGH